MVSAPSLADYNISKYRRLLNELELEEVETLHQSRPTDARMQTVDGDVRPQSSSLLRCEPPVEAIVNLSHNGADLGRQS
ncbi:hypothetical protein TYRP_006531 [Tyrophagus putrescentiae]|nr:hypothetical protein TYRP_006531 [Tyrophagus putrescentiae]